MATQVVTPRNSIPVEMEGAYIPPQVVTIANIYPQEFKVHIPRRNVSEFVVPAGTPQKPGLCAVEDTFESNGTMGAPKLTRILAERTAAHIVQDLTLNIFGVNAAIGAVPGVFICASPNGPTPAEIAEHEPGNTAYLRLQVDEARRYHADPKERHQVRQEKYHVAARALGVRGEEWQTDPSKDRMKKCASCAEFIDVDAKKCPKCQEYQSDEAAAEFGRRRALASGAVPIAAPVVEVEVPVGAPVVAPVVSTAQTQPNPQRGPGPAPLQNPNQQNRR